MALLSIRPMALALGLAAAAGCASETWDNPYDPDAPGYRGPCADAPAGESATCVLWEEFDHGLGRWRADGVGVAKADPTGKVATVLAVPACRGAATVEIEFGAPTLALDVVWSGRTRPKLSLNGEPISLADAPSETAGWTESFTDLAGRQGTTALLSVASDPGDGACEGVGLYVARVTLRKAAE